MITDIFSALRAGKALANADTWANRGVAAQAVLAVLSLGACLAPMFGVRFDVDSDTLQSLAGGIAAAGYIVFGLLHTATNPHAGLPAPAGTVANRGGDTAGDGKPPATPEPPAVTNL